MALGNLALAAADGAEAASNSASSDPAHSGFLSPKDVKTLKMVAPAALGLALGWYSRAANNYDLAPDALFKDSAAAADASRAAIVVSSARVVTSSSPASSPSPKGGGATTSELLPHPDALFNLGQVFYGGRGGLPGGPQPLRGMLYFERAAEHGDCAAHFFLAHAKRCGDEGAGWEPYHDPDAAVAHLVAATEPKNKGGGSINSRSSGSSDSSDSSSSSSSSASAIEDSNSAPIPETSHGPAAYYRALLHRSGDPNLPPPFHEANLGAFRHWVGAAAGAGDGEAIFCLADCHLHGSDGFPRVSDRTTTLYA